MASTKTSYKVGIVCGSTRKPRAGPQITSFVQDTIQTHLDSSPSTKATIGLELIDISTFDLPLFDEPGVPQAITDPSEYTHQHTRDWSARVSPLDAFVFVTPQYNWGVPAALKNAIDFLFNEWKGKPAMVVSYGGHGGGRAAEALRTVCLGLRMGVVEKTVNLAFPDQEFRDKCFKGEDLGLGREGFGAWARERDEVIAVWDEMVGPWRS